jgi:thiol-disulfide isomerase/thioredoxin
MAEKALKDILQPSGDRALLLVGTHCPHCPAVIMALSELVKAGELASIEIVNLEQRPDVAQQLNVRTVPWVKIGEFELEGLRSKAEFQQWITRARNAQGMQQYFEDLLAGGQVNKVVELINRDNAALQWVIELLRDADAKINLRLGIGVVMEEFASTQPFQQYIPTLEQLCQHEDARVRADACHYLALTENPSVVPVLQAMLNDANEEVREVAQDGLDELGRQ